MAGPEQDVRDQHLAGVERHVEAQDLERHDHVHPLRAQRQQDEIGRSEGQADRHRQGDVGDRLGQQQEVAPQEARALLHRGEDAGNDLAHHRADLGHRQRREGHREAEDAQRVLAEHPADEGGVERAVAVPGAARDQHAPARHERAGDVPELARPAHLKRAQRV